MKRNLILIMCLALSVMVQAQSAHWAIAPTYKAVTRFSPTLFKVKTATNVGICDAKGNWTVPLSMDSITNIINGYALAMTTNDGQYRLVYVIKENGTKETVKEELYISDFSYFSEDRCPVIDKKGRYGYIDPSGRLVIACNYATVQPFQNGHATVSKAKGVISGLIKKVAKKNSSEYFELSLNGNERALENVDMGSLSTNSLDIMNKPYVPTPDPSYQRLSENDVYGYTKGSNIILPSQFKEGERVAGDCAIVMTEQQYGVVQFNSASVDCKVNEVGGKLKAEATVPSVWENKVAKLSRIVNDDSRTEFEMEGTGTRRTLDMDVVGESGKVVYELACENLVLWRSSTHATNVSAPAEKTRNSSGKANSGGGISVSAPATVKADAKNVCAINIRVVNHGTTARLIILTLSTGQSSSIQLPAGKSGNVTVNVPITKDTVCKITASGGGVSSSCSTTLKAKFVL